jgi:hypothetical protein
MVIDVREAMRQYQTTTRVSELQRREKLQQVIDHSKRLRVTLDSLDAGTRLAIVAPAQRSSYAVHPPLLAQQLKLLIAQSEKAKRDSAPPRRGPLGLDPRLKQLIGRLGIIWSIENPAVKGIVANKGERSGPMLTFVLQRLRREKIRFHSRASVAKVLYEMRRQITTRAAAQRQKQEITRVSGHTRIISRE